MTVVNKTSQPLNIVIIGGSLAGLLHGVVLRRLNHNVTILERTAASIPENQGAGLAVATDLRNYMSTYDLTGLPYGVTSPDFRMINAKGEVVRHIGIEQVLSSWECIYYRLRANFDGLESVYVPSPPKKGDLGEGKAEYRYGKTVTGLKELDGKVSIEYADHKGKEEAMEVDLIVAADGPSSFVRQMFEPTVERKYAGFCCWRGTIPESEIFQDTIDFFGGLATFCKIEKSYLISYAIPGKEGELEVGHRLRNWAWYRLYPEGSPSHTEVMTATDGHQHRITVPIGKIREQIWERQKTLAAELLDPYSAELVTKTTKPFIQAITDVVSPRATFLQGKILLVGDALATFRPMTGQSTNQAARNATDMRQWLEGRITLEEWENKSLDYARKTQELGVERAKGFGLAE